MKKNYYLILLLLYSVFQAQIVNIPDANLKTKLLAADISNTIAKDNNLNNIKIDINGNNEIDTNEVLAVYHLNLSASQNQTSNLISNISGLSTFSNLKSLNLDFNNLTSVDATPFTNLQILHVSFNQLNSLSVNNLLNLKTFSCRGPMNLTTLDISNLPSLEDFRCNNNQLTTLNLSNKPNLKYLYCSNNNFTSLDVSGLTNLEYLDIGNNPISYIDLSGISKIKTFACMFTNIQTVNVMGQNNLQDLLVGNNPSLEYVFMKNGSYESGRNFEYLPNLKYVCIDSNIFLENYYMQLISTTGGNNFVVNSYCNFSPGGASNLINGNVRYDINNNGCDINDLSKAFQKFTISGSGGSGNFFSNYAGSYSLALQTGSHTITPVLENPNYFTVSPTTLSVNFPTQTSPLNQNFCLANNGNHNDLEVVIIPVTAASPGFDAKYKIVYKNKGTSAQSGTIVYNFNDNLMNFLSSTAVPNSQATGVLSWNFTNLLPFETKEITLNFKLNTPIQTPALNGGDILNYSTQINGLTDETPSDNIFVLNQTVVNSFDPNDKTCLEGTAITQAKVGDYVHYLIRFENTGTANAQNIVVKDELDTSKFDISSLIPLNASHNFVTRITNPNVVEFIFENIQLPFDDANNDGYVSFKIKTKSTLNIGDSFSNLAKIYFDYNHPIITNSYTTTVQNVLSTTENLIEKNSVSIYPNPVKDILHIKSKNEIIKAEIYDSIGRIILSAKAKENAINVAELSKGAYMIKLFLKDHYEVQKFIKD
ncbi:hypothetical protein BA768_02585 [Chryseobacterium sp. CBo1]|uniref:DUF7619 domain-containing protein n=1 Tax=Chryseobacterium sp. CBo1 TaxID=1869230 RepID=UPI000810D381|nr:leucine-rich repeat domain-containing protein [Chryseobacterium sp. CBo1]OCK51619.1 hypothetical protein BA768_02585 [Chryseobacterium sp. CBo1]